MYDILYPMRLEYNLLVVLHNIDCEVCYYFGHSTQAGDRTTGGGHYDFENVPVFMRFNNDTCNIAIKTACEWFTGRAGNGTIFASQQQQQQQLASTT
jgi:hypothetical protein